MLFFIYFIAVYALPPPFPIPAGNLPSGSQLPTDLSGVKVVIIGGTRGIGNATAWEFHNRGASVTITTRNLINGGDYGPFTVMELEYGQDKSVEKFVNKYVKQVGRIPDVLLDMGLTLYGGNILDFKKEDMEYATKMYITDPLLLIKEMLVHNNVSRPFNISIAISTTSYGATTSFLGLYPAGKIAKKDFIRDFAVYQGPKYYPNVRITGIACSNVNTTLALTGYNPSVEMGDPVNVKFLQVAIMGAKVYGTDPTIVAKAHLEATTLLTHSNNTIYLVQPSASGRILSEILHNIYVNDNTTQYVIDSREYYTLNGVNMTI